MDTGESVECGWPTSVVSLQLMAQTRDTTVARSRQRCRRLAGICVTAVIASALVSAQTSQEQPTFRSGVEVIEIDVSVLDGRGRLITDLAAHEFTVTVDGEPRRVEQAQFVSLRPPDRDDSTLESEPLDVFYTSNSPGTPGRLIVIAIDEESILFGEGRRVMQAAGAFLDTLGPSDRVALMAVPTGRYVDFTSDHEFVRQTIDGMAGLGARVRRDLNIGLFEAFRIAEYNDRDVLADVIARVCDGSPGCALRVEPESHSIVQEVKFHVRNSRRALESILDALRDVEGRKTVVWISGGFVIDSNAASLREVEELAAASRTTVYVILVDDPLSDVTEASAQPTPRQDRMMKTQGLQAIAAFTRGELFRASINPGAVFDRLAEELSGYYLLGVEARATDRDEERRDIKVTVSRKGARVRARREVRFTQEPDEAGSPSERMTRVLQSPVFATELPLRIATYAFPDGERARVMVATEVRSEVDASPDLTVGFVLRDPEGTVLASGTQQVTATRAETASGPVLEDSRSILVDAGTYSLKVAVVDAAGRRGSVDHRVEALPHRAGPLRVGDLMVSERPVAPGVYHPRVEAHVAGGWLVAYTELQATDAFDFGQTRVVVEVADDPTGPTRASGVAVLDGPTDEPRRVVSAEVRIDHLLPGRYVARARVMDGDIEVTRLYRPFRITEPPKGRLR